MNRRLLGSALFGLLLAACGDDTETLPGSGGEGGGGAGGAGASSTGGGGGGAPVVCGGSAGATCGETEYCDTRETADDACPGEAQGVCVPRPSLGDCPEDCPGVCGCDQRVYCNACLAHAAGMNASEDTSCASADYVIGAHDSVYVHHADLEANRCLTLYLAWPTESPPHFADVELPEFWALLSVSLTGEMRDCTQPRTPDADGLHDVTGAAGTMSWEPEPVTGIPCIIDMDITATLDGGPETERFEATGVVVDNTCL
ncbi:hypothetical protein WME75_35055 [Sorangium sp. So ce1014]|uniref:hypothetical protein n=1 Tax=Sorangium sp. So ce1014 TaxID=3133326 RepID=UPI003F5F54DC